MHSGNTLNVAKKGFTLLELLVVLVILGMLAAYVAPKYFGQLGKSEAKIAQTQMKAIETALDSYRLDIGHYPTTEQGLSALNTAPSDEVKWQGPYLKSTIPNDPWGRAYKYVSPTQEAEFELKTLGKDNAPGGTAENADIVIR
jgi:general secretion pathway protein G